MLKTASSEASAELALDASRYGSSVSGRWVFPRLTPDVTAKRPLSVLDVGCWDGSLLADLPPDVARAGIEPNRAAAERARARGLDVVQGFVEDVTLDHSTYDVVTLIDVLEHLRHPHEVIVRLASVVRPRGGRLVVLTGNAGSPGCRFWGADWYYLHYPEHVSFFSHQSVRATLAAANLTVETLAHVAHPGASRIRDVEAAFRHVLAREKDAHDVSLRSRVGVNAVTASRLLRGRDHLFVVAARM